MFATIASGIIFYIAARKIYERTKPDAKKYYREALIRAGIVILAVVIGSVSHLMGMEPIIARAIPLVVASAVLIAEFRTSKTGGPSDSPASSDSPR